MPNTIRHKRSATASAAPVAASLVAGELAVNTADGRVYTKQDSGTVVDIAQAILATGQTIVCAAGSATACGIAPVGDLHTGLFFAADTINISTGGVQRLQVSSAGDVGLGVTAAANVKFYALQSTTNAASTVGHQIVTTCVATATGSYSAFGAYFVIRTDVAAGTTNSGAQRGFFSSVARNNNGPTGADAGTLTYLRGAEIQYGHSIANTALTPTTTQAVGLFLSPLVGYGTVTDMYDLYLAADAHSLGTVTNHYAIYQASSTARNYFLGNVGIGTSRTNPSSALDVNGVVTVSAGSAAAPSIVPTGDTNTGIYSPGADQLGLATGGVARLTVAANGAVNTTADFTCGGTFRTNTALQSTGGRSLFRAVNEPYAVGSAYSATSGFVYFGAANESATPDARISNAGGASLMYFQNGGNVGIGTTSPRGVFDVTHASGGSTDTVAFGAGNVSYPTTRYVGASAIVSKGTITDARLMVQDGNGRLNNYWNAYTDSATSGSWKYIVSNEPATRYTTAISGTTGGTHAWYGAPAGTAGGAITWTQLGSLISGTGGNVWFSPRGTISDFWIADSGNVGIGTTSPGSKLTVTGTASVTGVLGVSAGNAAAPAIVPTSDTNTGTYYPVADTIAWATGGTERMRIASDGAVSIPGEFKPTAITEAVVAIGDSGNAVTLSITNGTVLTITNNSTTVVPYNGPRLTITPPPPASAGKRFTLMMKVVATGSAVLIWNTVPYSGAVKWPGNTDPTISGWAGTPSLFPFYVFDFVSDGTNWYGRASSAYLTT